MANAENPTKETINFVTALQTLGRPIAYWPVISMALGYNGCGIFISQFLFWEGKQQDPEGWIHKTQTELTQETGLSRHEQETARKKLRELNIITEELRGVPARLYFKFDWDRLNAVLSEYTDKVAEAGKPIADPIKPGAPSEPRPDPILFRMREAFLEAHAKQYTKPEDKYAWMEKDWNKIKLLKVIFYDRQHHKKANATKPPAENVTVTDDEVAEAWIKFLAALPDWVKEKQFTTYGIHSTFQSIIQDINNASTANNKQGKDNGRGGSSFAELAREGANNAG